MKQVIAKVISNEQILGELQRADARTFKRSEARNILGSWIIWLSCPDIAREARPGQFVMVRCEGECILPRPFSIHQVNDEGDMALFFAVLEEGEGTKWLSRRQKGDTLELFGPLGNGFFLNPDSHNLLLVAGGIGIAPLYFLAQEALGQRLSVTLLRGVSGEKKPSGKENPDQHYPEDRLPHEIKLETITSSYDAKTGAVTGVVRDLIPKYVDWADQIFVCGPVPMYRDMALQKRELKLGGKPVQVSLEVRMGCGRGVCYGCTVKTTDGLKQVCQDGPVFDLDDILWDELPFP